MAHTLIPLLTAEEVAEYLGISRKTLFNQRTRREPPGALGLKVGRCVRWEPDVLEAQRRIIKGAEW